MGIGDEAVQTQNPKETKEVKHTFIIDGRMAGLNEMTKANRYNRFAGGKQKKDETERVMWAIKASHIPPIDNPVTIHFSWYEPNLKRDVGNVRAGEKFISDALVKMGIIKDDSQRYVKGMSDSFHLDRDNPRIEVAIEEIK